MRRPRPHKQEFRDHKRCYPKPSAVGWSEAREMMAGLLAEAEANPALAKLPSTAALRARIAEMDRTEWDRCAICDVPRWGHGQHPFSEPAKNA